ncbi:hypothetical protein [Capnocytophaga sp. CM59]|uniref:hypothetical protein n=1 Tax=Capnocytophaga sp. CM59 TaxID=936370 RepID=UPI000A06B8AF|nr:hypothetical protein [Capnocytophaga sp. CM59]
MRKLIYLILSLVAVPVFAQEEQWVRSSSLGFKGGINQVQNTNAPLSVIIVTHKYHRYYLLCPKKSTYSTSY